MSSAAPVISEWRPIAQPPCFFCKDPAIVELRCGRDGRVKSGFVCRDHVEAFRGAFEGADTMTAQWEPVRPEPGWRNTFLDPIPSAAEPSMDAAIEAFEGNQRRRDYKRGADLVVKAAEAGPCTDGRSAALGELRSLCGWCAPARQGAQEKLAVLGPLLAKRGDEGFEQDVRFALQQ